MLESIAWGIEDCVSQTLAYVKAPEGCPAGLREREKEKSICNAFSEITIGLYVMFFY